MQRIQHPTATPDNRFTEGSPTSGTPATVVTAAFLNSVQEEIASTIEAAGIPLNVGANDQFRKAIFSLVYPVGCVFISTSIQTPFQLFGIGTWENYAAGRVLVGLDVSDPVFDVVGETGGAKEITLSVEQMPAHRHSIERGSSTTGAGGGAHQSFVIDETYEASSTNTFNATNPVRSVGGGQPHSNLQPYQVILYWRRTA